MFHDLLEWLQNVPGATDGDPSTSWSQQFVGSLHLWSLTEGTHVLSLMLFAGTILMVDLRMLGVAFRDVPYSTLNNRILPYTVAGFGLAAVTGALLLFSNPVHYYHSVWFRAKVIFLVVAAVNIFWFHYRVQKNLPDWDARPRPPTAVKLAAAVSLASWILVILFGRLMAFNFFECDSMQPGSFGYAFAECESAMRDAIAAEAEAEAAAAAADAEAASEDAEAPPPDAQTDETDTATPPDTATPNAGEEE